MPVIDKQYLGAEGIDTRESKFLINKARAQILENISVRTRTRKRRQQYSRWKYDRYYSNSVRFLGTYKKAFAVVKDSINTHFNSFGTSQNSTLEVRFRLPGVGGYSLRGTHYICSRRIHGTGYTFELQLIANTSPAYDEYYPRFILEDGSGVYTINFSSSTFIRHGEWYTLSIVKDNSNNRFRALLNGVFTENVAFTGTPGGAQGVFNTTRDEGNYADIIIGAETNFTKFSPIDIDELRIWNEARSDSNVLAYYDKKLPSNARTNLICYVNFNNLHDGNVMLEEVTNDKIFFGTNLPFKDSNDYLVFDGTAMFGKLNPIGAVLTIPYNLWGGGNGGSIYKVSEVALKILKLKPGNLIGGLELYYDSTDSKYGFRFKFINNNVATYISSGGIINTSDIDNTDYYIAIRSFESATAHIELWVNGVQKASTNYVGVHGSPAGEPGRYVGCGPAGNSKFSCIRLKWFRVYDSEIVEDSYFTTKYNQEVDEFKLIEYSHGVASSVFASGTSRTITGTDTELNSKFDNAGPANNQRYFSQRENKDGFPESNYQDTITNLNTGAQTFTLQNADSTGDPWVGTGTTKITNKEGYEITTLLTRYNSESWKNIKQDKDTFKTTAQITSKVTGTFDRDRDPGYTLEFYSYINTVNIYLVEMPMFIAGTMKSSSKPCRYLGQFKSSDGLIDVIISIVGTSFNVFDRTTKQLKQYGTISILPNDDKPFSGDFFDGGLYLTDGKTKIHVYSYRGELRVIRWGFPRGEKPTLTSLGSITGLTTGTFQFSYCYYNRELDQYGPLCFQSSDGFGPEITVTSIDAIQLDNITPSPTFFEGCTDIAIFMTKNLDAADGIEGHYWLADFTRGNSKGGIKWFNVSTSLIQRYPLDLTVSEVSLSPPNGEFAVAHNRRLWVADFDKLRYSRIGSELHEGVIFSETHVFSPDGFLSVQGNRKITGAISFYDKILFIFTNSSMDMAIGNDENDFEIRRIHDGIGCVSNRTLSKYGEAVIWLGLDDIYISRGSIPSPLDQEGRISKYIKDELDKTRLDESFAILNKQQMIYELHAYRNDGVPIVIYYDLKIGQFTIGKDIRASYICEVSDENNIPNIFIGTVDGFIVSEDDEGLTYKPTTGSIKTTISSVDIPNSTITVNASDLQITEAGLIGCTVYIVSKQAATEGSVYKVVVGSNTNNTITFKGSEDEFVFGSVFVPAINDVVYISPIFTKWKTGVHYFTSPQDNLAINEVSSGLNASEPVHLDLIHNRSGASGDCYISIFRDGQSTLSKIFKVPTLNDDFSRVQLVSHTRSRFAEFELFHLDESSEFEIIGYSIGINIDEGVISGAS